MLRFACMLCGHYGSQTYIYILPEALDDKCFISFCLDSVNDFEQVILTCVELANLVYIIWLVKELIT